MRVDSEKKFHDTSLDHALSLLLANVPSLLPLAGLSFAPDSNVPVRKRRLASIARYLKGLSQSINFECYFEDLELADLECLILSLEVLLQARCRAAHDMEALGTSQID
jgi:hypothetical protein